MYDKFVGYIVHKGQFQAFRVDGSYRRGMTRGELVKKVVQVIDEFLGKVSAEIVNSCCHQSFSCLNKVEIMCPEHQAGLFGGPEGLQLRDLFLLHLEPVSKRGFDCVLGYRQPIGSGCLCWVNTRFLLKFVPILGRLAQTDPRTVIQHERHASPSHTSTHVAHGRVGTHSTEAIMPAVYDSPAPILLIHALPPSWSPLTIGAGENLPTPHTLLTNDLVLRSRFLYLSRTTPNPESLGKRIASEPVNI